MRKLSLRAALHCENALTKRCKCRCGGSLHGAARNVKENPLFYEHLPESDPHYALSKDRAREQRNRKIAKSLPLFDEGEGTPGIRL